MLCWSIEGVASRLFLSLVVFGNLVLSIMGQTTSFESDCVLEQYYAGFIDRPVSEWDGEEVATLLQDTHRRVLPYTSSTREDVWDALIDLDGRMLGSTRVVNLIYRNDTLPAFEFGVPTTWNREHLWPKSRGVGTSGADYTDVHALRPSDWNVNSARSNLFFGDCQDLCEDRPAAPEAALDTAKDDFRFFPPAAVRGDVARAILYMQLRYSSPLDTNTEVLELTDCPDESVTNQMAYLSELLQWHADDPPDEEEIQRNNQVCARWQGNRNPFVDFPELATRLHGLPAERPYDCSGASDSSTTPPTQSPTKAPVTAAPVETTTPDAACNALNPGDLFIVSLSADNPDSLALVALTDLPESLKIFATDNAWTGTELRSNEGTLEFQVPVGGIKAGTVFGYGDAALRYSAEWSSVGGSFALSTSGDSILVYCERAGDDAEDVNFLTGIMFGGDWTNDSVAASNLSTNDSILPQSLSKGGSISMSQNRNWDNLVYSGPTEGQQDELLQELSKESSWQGSSTNRRVYDGGDFEVVQANLNPTGGPSDSSSASAMAPSRLALFAVLVAASQR